MMSKDKKWLKILALALSLPTTIIAAAWFFMHMVTIGVIGKTFGIILFLVVIFNTLFLMVFYAYKKKN
jgi:hypothetical protein